MRVPQVAPIPGSSDSGEYEALIVALGYERRSRFAAETLRPRARNRFACGFTQQHVLSFAENRDCLEGLGFDIEIVSDDEFAIWCDRVLASSRNDRRNTQRLCIDISSLSRYRIAVLLDRMRRLEWSEQIVADFLYVVAEFSKPNVSDIPNVHVGPVTPEFAGWTRQPELPPIAVVGLGYERDRALGAVEHVQAGEVWCFAPRSSIAEYEGALLRANRALLESLPAGRLLWYDVENPFECFVRLESMIYRAVRTGSPLLFPFGPKVFTLCSLLVGCIYPDASVWRVSAGGAERPLERIASHTVTGLRVTLPRSIPIGGMPWEFEGQVEPADAALIAAVYGA